MTRARRLATALVAAACLVTGLVGGSLAGASPAMAMGPLPACRYDDILTQPRGYSQWATTLVDTILRVPKTYIPPDLTAVSAAGLSGPFQVRGIAIPDLTLMVAAAKEAGAPLAVQSAYRSYTTQQSTFNYWVSLSGYRLALLYSARPGHSEHQLGLAIDFKSAAGGAPWTGDDWGQSPAGSWLRAHAWAYGFVQSYPKGQQAKTCYSYESWHFRYVGRAEAAAIHASGLTPREYLWAHYTTAVVPPVAARPTASPSHAPSPGASPGASPGPSELPSDNPSEGPSAPIESQPGASASAAASQVTPVETGPPASPVAAWFGQDPALLAASGALLALLIALVVSIGLGRRRRRSS
jgi:zinc D-Ala-D-Ala carboxypeptidase